MVQSLAALTMEGSRRAREKNAAEVEGILCDWQIKRQLTKTGNEVGTIDEEVEGMWW